MRQRTVAEDAVVDVRLVNRFMANTVTILAEFVPVEDLDAALDRLRALHAACVPTAAPPQAASTRGIRVARDAAGRDLWVS
jgi:hypothetical protein